MQIKKFLKETIEFGAWGNLKVRPRLVCRDGFTMSVQASNSHYCEPTEILADGDYESVEIAFPSEVEESLIPYIDGEDNDYTSAIYGLVPIEIVEEIIEKHGGIVDGCK